MGKKKVTASQTDGITYRRSSNLIIALATLPSAAFFSSAIGYVSYAANLGFGISTVLIGTLMTLMRIFDGITDPVLSLIIDKVNTRFGKIRLFLILGWVIMSLSLKMLYDWFCNGTHSVGVFLLIYMVYYIGYTCTNMACALIGPVLTNDPKQRPMIGVWNTIYNYIIAIIFSIGVIMVLLPQNGGEYTISLLKSLSNLTIICSGIFMLLSIAGISTFDKPENFTCIKKNSSSKISWRDMLALVKENKALQCFILAATSDKLAMNIAGQSIIGTLLYGIIVGNMALSAILNMIAIFPAFIFAIIGARYTGKKGSSQGIKFWSEISVVLHSLFIVILLVTANIPIAQSVPMMIIFVILTIIKNGTTIAVSIATSSMQADVVDYEAYRSGNYMPGTVAGVYSLIDKLVSSFGALIATAFVSLVGYKDALPQPTDEKTIGIVVIGIIVVYVFPIIGYLCSIIAMKKTPVTKEKMIEVQKTIAERKESAEV